MIIVVTELVDDWCGNKKGVGKKDGICWNDKEETLVSSVDIDGRNICKYEINSGA